MQALIELKEEQGELNEKDDKTLEELKQQAEEEIIKGLNRNAETEAEKLIKEYNIDVSKI